MNVIREKYEDFKDTIRADTCFMRFCSAFQQKYKLKQEHKSFKKEQLDDALTSLRADYEEKDQFDKFFRHWKAVKNFVLGPQNGKEMGDSAATVKNFCADQHHTMLSHLTAFGTAQYNQMLDLCQGKGHNTETCSIKVLDICLSDTEAKGGKSLLPVQPPVQNDDNCAG